MSTATEQLCLEALLTSDQIEPDSLTPELAKLIGPAELDSLRTEIRTRYGSYRSATPDGPPGRYLVRYEHGAFPVLIGVDQEQRIEMLWLGAAAPGTATALWIRLLGTLTAVLPAIAPLVLVHYALTATSRTGALEAVVVTAALLVAGWLHAPWAWFGLRTRVAAAAVTAALTALAVQRLPGLPTGHPDLWSLPFSALTVLGAVGTVLGSREPRSELKPLLITNPLPGGSPVHVFQGGGRSVNHHAKHPVQRYALDLMTLGRFGARAGALLPRQLESYHTYGQVVVAPCDATVLATFDGYDDQPAAASPLESRPQQDQHPVGNRIALGVTPVLKGGDRVEVMLAHLKLGSVLVRPGDSVVAGQPLALVGNSGNTTEPHLHIHAVARTAQGFEPVRLRLARHPGRPLRRGRRLDR